MDDALAPTFGPSLRPADSLQLWEALDCFQGSTGADDTGAFDQATVDTFFARCFPWLDDELPGEPADPLLTAGTSSYPLTSCPAGDAVKANPIHSPQQPLDLPFSRSSTVTSASNSDGRVSQDLIKQSSSGSGGTPVAYDLGAAAAAAVAAAVAATASSAPDPPAPTNTVVVNNGSSWVSWGPPKPSPPPPQPAQAPKASRLPSMTWLKAAIPGVPIPTDQPPPLNATLGGPFSAGAAFTLPSADPPRQHSAPASSLFPSSQSGLDAGQLSPPTMAKSAPSLGHLLYDDALLDSMVRLGPGGSHAQPVKRASTGLPGHAAQQASAGAVAKARGRRSGGAAGGGSAASLGRTSYGVAKDTTRRKVAEIVRLEQELQEKLTLASELEKQREELERRERLLKLQVSTRERRLFCQSVAGITPHLKSAIQSFRTSFNQMIGGTLLAQMSEDPKQFTLKDFMITWQSFVHEIAGLMLEDPSASSNLFVDVCERACNWCMSVCVYAPDVIVISTNINMQTGEESVPSLEFWAELVEKLGLTEQQVTDIQMVFNIYSSLLLGMADEHTRLMQELTLLVDQDISRGNPLAGTTMKYASCEVLDKKEDLFKQLDVCDRQCHMLHTMLSFLVLSLLDTRQKCVTIFNSFPNFPNMKLIMAVICKAQLSQMVQQKQQQ